MAELRKQAIAKAEAVRGNAARLASAPTLCLCKRPDTRGLAARMLLVQGRRLAGVGADDRIHEIAGAFGGGPRSRAGLTFGRRVGRRRLLADPEPLLAAGQRDPVRFAALDASARRGCRSRRGDPRHLRGLSRGGV
jgi:hypothetical protein